MPMHKRILCVLLAAVLMLSLLPGLALPARAASNMKTSEKCIEILKEMEGFIPKPKYDHGQYSVGYGSGCEKDDYPDGITREEADALLREYLEKMEKAVNQFATRYGIIFAQNQFDALMLFTYNCGPNWVNSDGEFRKAVIEGRTGNAFIFPITLWSSASSVLNLGLVERRLIEADMYLNGNYTNKKPSNYTYVVYDLNGGVSDVKVQGYDCNRDTLVKSIPTRTGYRFLGWYSAAVGGSWVRELSVANAEQTLYAHWQEVTGEVKGTSARYTLSASELLSRNCYSAPGGAAAGTLKINDSVTIVADYVDEKGDKWGKLPNGKWVRLGDPLTGTCTETAEEDGVQVTVTGDYVNVRSGPGTGYEVVAGVVRGEKLTITHTCQVGNMLWGKFRAGWLCLEYTDYQGGITPSKPEETLPDTDTGNDKVLDTGVVTADSLNIRAAAGTAGYVVGCYFEGDRVEILDKTTVNGTPWGKTNRGWICLTYVKLDSASAEAPQETTEPTTEATTPSTQPPETTEPETKPQEPEKEPEQKPTAGVTGTVTSKAGLNIRSGPGVNYAVCGGYTSGMKITILEQRNVNGTTWGRTDKGWVSMNYVKLDTVTGDQITTGSTGVITAGTLCIRSGAGTGNAIVGTYNKGDIVTILETKKVGTTSWGRTDKGWICMDYVTATAPVTPPTTEPQPNPGTEETPSPDTGTQQKPGTVTGTVTANGLNVRSAPATGAIVGGYKKGDVVTILEQRLVGGSVWGRTDKGWISLNYVKLNANTDGSVTAGYSATVTASTLCIRKGPGTASAIVGSYSKGQTVTILETTKVGAVLWGRTDKGWICMDYVK